MDSNTIVLDYGCGRGDDTLHLQAIGIEAIGWDPVYLNIRLKDRMEYRKEEIVLDTRPSFPHYSFHDEQDFITFITLEHGRCLTHRKDRSA